MHAHTRASTQSIHPDVIQVQAHAKDSSQLRLLEPFQIFLSFHLSEAKANIFTQPSTDLIIHILLLAALERACCNLSEG